MILVYKIITKRSTLAEYSIINKLILRKPRFFIFIYLYAVGFILNFSHIYIYIYIYIYLCTSRMRHKVISKRSLTGLNSGSFFSETGCVTKIKQHQSAILFTHSWKDNNWIRIFPNGISVMWNANCFVKDSNSCRQVHFLEWHPLHKRSPSWIGRLEVSDCTADILLGLHKNATCCFEQILEATPHKTAAVRSLTSHIKVRRKKKKNTCWALLVK